MDKEKFDERMRRALARWAVVKSRIDPRKWDQVVREYQRAVDEGR